MRKKMLFVLVVVVVGCMSMSCNRYLYKFKIIDPATAQTVEKPTADDPHSSIMTYSDSLIEFTFNLVGQAGNGYDGPSYIYSGISFILINKTDSIVTLDWNKISFIDGNGSSGNSVMHTGIKYNECSSSKPSTTIPPRGKLTDDITPCYGLHFFSSQYGSYWHASALPLAGDNTNIKFGVFIPIAIGTILKNYTFSFNGESFVEN